MHLVELFKFTLPPSHKCKVIYSEEVPSKEMGKKSKEKLSSTSLDSNEAKGIPLNMTMMCSYIRYSLEIPFAFGIYEMRFQLASHHIYMNVEFAWIKSCRKNFEEMSQET
jgi:hypothetical protein